MLWCAILSVLSFHVIVFTRGRSVSMIGLEMATVPAAGLGVGILMFLMTGSCFGKQTGFKRRLCLLGVAALQSLCGLAIVLSGDHGGTLFTSIPFWASSIPLLVRRLRQDPEKEAAEKADRLGKEKARLNKIHSTLSSKPPSA